MNNKCLNYKFILLMSFPLTGIILSVVFWHLIPYNGLSLLVLVFSLLCFSILLYFEPIAYIITENNIKIVCAFKQYCFLFQEIQQIALRYDTIFELLFVKDYVLILDVQTKIPERCRRILKCANTKILIEEYYLEKVEL